MRPQNARSTNAVRVQCSCRGLNPGCVICNGTAEVSKLACRRCSGTGRTGGICQDCRGDGWRELDQPTTF